MTCWARPATVSMTAMAITARTTHGHARSLTGPRYPSNSKENASTTSRAPLAQLMSWSPPRLIAYSAMKASTATINTGSGRREPRGSVAQSEPAPQNCRTDRGDGDEHGDILDRPEAIGHIELQRGLHSEPEDDQRGDQPRPPGHQGNHNDREESADDDSDDRVAGEYRQHGEVERPDQRDQCLRRRCRPTDGRDHRVGLRRTDSRRAITMSATTRPAVTPPAGHANDWAASGWAPRRAR